MQSSKFYEKFEEEKLGAASTEKCAFNKSALGELTSANRVIFSGQMIWEGLNREWFGDIVFCKIFKVSHVVTFNSL